MKSILHKIFTVLKKHFNLEKRKKILALTLKISV